MGDIPGDEPLVEGMTITLRYRRDFVVTDPARLLATARRLYRDSTQTPRRRTPRLR